MGCDIHAIVERKTFPYGNRESWRWRNSGTPGISRNYVLFSMLANVRNDWEVPFTPIAQPRGVPGYEIKTDNYGRFESLGRNTDWNESPSDAYESLVLNWGVDGHSHSWVTLRELKDAKELIQGYYWEDGIPKYVLDDYYNLLGYMEHQKYDGQTDEEIRLVFFFDN
jgi:hypothetical protein